MHYFFPFLVHWVFLMNILKVVFVIMHVISSFLLLFWSVPAAAARLRILSMWILDSKFWYTPILRTHWANCGTKKVDCYLSAQYYTEEEYTAHFSFFCNIQWAKMWKKVHFGRIMHCFSQRLTSTFFENFSSGWSPKETCLEWIKNFKNHWF